MDFDPGYGAEPWRTLCADVPGEDVYPPRDFRTEWGPIFHRGRLDGSARLLVVGQDPAAQEAFARRILVGLAGQRVQGLLAKLGITRSYTMVNCFVYSVASQSGGEKHRDDEKIADYRNRWFDALLLDTGIEAVLACGSLAGGALRAWQRLHPERSLLTRRVLHPTYPESASAAGSISLPEAMRRLCDDWNDALDLLRPTLGGTDAPPVGERYGDAVTDADLRPIPAVDLPPGLPAWTRSGVGWAQRVAVADPGSPAGDPGDERRATLVVRVPVDDRSWP